MPRALRRTLAAAVLSALACSDGTSKRGTEPPPGEVRAKVLLTDAPFPYDSVARVDLHIVKIEASQAADTTGAGEWVMLAAPDHAYNLLELTQGLAQEVGAGTIPAATYRAIRLTIDADRTRLWAKYAVDAANTPRAGASAVSVDWQSSRGQAVLYALVEKPMAFTRADAEIVIDFDVGRSFICEAFCSRFIFSPVFRAVNRDATGTIEGRVLGDTLSTNQEPVPNTTVSVFDGEIGQPEATWRLAATGKTDGAGAFRIAYLPAGRYILRADAPRESPYTAGVRAYVTVAVGETTSGASITLPTQSLEGLAVTGLETALQPGQNGYLLVWARARDGHQPAPEEITFESSNPTVATVVPCLVTMSSCRAPTGVVQAGSAGVTTITVRYGSLARSTNVFVGTLPPAATLTITPRDVRIGAGDTVLFRAVARDAAGNEVSNTAVQWSTSDVQVTEPYGVPGPGQIIYRGLRNGRAMIFAALGGQRDSVLVTVGGGGTPAPVSYLTMMPRWPIVAAGDSVVFTATTYAPNDDVLAGRLVQWTVSDPAVARVQSWSAAQPNRLALRTLGVGSSVVTATSEGRSIQMLLTVGPAGSVVDDASSVATIEVGPAGPTVHVGDTLRFYVIPRDRVGHLVSGQHPYTHSMNELVATVDSVTGLARARAPGTATVRGSVYTPGTWVSGMTELKVVP